MTNQSIREIISRVLRLSIILFVVLQLCATGASVAGQEDSSNVTGQEGNAAVPTNSQHTIYLKSRVFQPATTDVAALAQLASVAQERVHILVQLDFIPREPAKEALRARGLRLLTYVPDYAWIASVPADDPTAILDAPGVIWAGELTTADKLDPAIPAGRWSAFNQSADGTVAVYVTMHKDESLQTGQELVAALDGTVTGQAYGINMLMAELPEDAVAALAAHDAVQWIEPAAPALREANDGIRTQIGVDVVNSAPYNLDGTGIDVMVYDGGRAGTHTDFGARLTHGDAAPFSEHATHVAGTVGGSGANSAAQGGSALQWQGMAPNVDLISYGIGTVTGIAFYEDVSDIETDWAAGQNTYGADIGTASLSSNIYANYPTRCDLMGKYGASAVLLDQIVRGGNTVVGVGDKYIATWAAGNERGWASSCGTYDIISPPAAAKNPIQVGGSNTNDNTQYAHTSWGPTEDGRIKPIVTAGGCQTSGDGGITSTDNFPADTYTVKCGTSMATPAVAGSLALMLQHYRDVYGTSGNFWPATGKAILIQTAVDHGNPGPDYQWGFGQIDTHAAVDLISRKAFRQENIDHGEIDLYYFIVGEDTDPVLVTLAWDDYEATQNADPTLINNLDLELVSPSGTIWRPWVLNPVSPTSNATRGTDNTNNQELIEVPSPEIGTWMVRVRGTTVPQGPQDYALVCEGCQPLDVGVCQAEVDGTAVAAQAGVPGLEDGGTTVTVPDREEPLTAGEIWQRALEVQTRSDDETYLQTSMELVAAAREAGPEALAALADTLRGPALDLAMEEIEEAESFLFEAADPRPTTGAISAAEEAAALTAQEGLEAENRARALALLRDSAEGSADVPVAAEQPSLPAAPAADLTVGSGCTYATIAAAITAANPNDRLLIEGGVTFAENLYINKNLTLLGGYGGCASGSTARTTIDGSASNRVIDIAAGVDVTLQDLNLTNGSTGFEGGGIRHGIGGSSGTLTLADIDVYANTAQWGGGIWIGPNAELIGSNVEIYFNSAGLYGGGIRLYGGRASLSYYSNVYSNTAQFGGGVFGTDESGHLPVLDLPDYSDVYDNQALTGSGLGGGVYLRRGTMTIADCSDINSNDAIAGGGTYVISSTVTIDGSCSEVQYNTATGDGGGIYAQGSTINLDDDAELYNNNAGTSGSGSGGGAYLDNSDLWSDKGSVRYNDADNYGGGIYATNSSIVDMDLGSYVCLADHCSRLYGNAAADYYGGGIYANTSTVWLDNIFVESNSADYGGGVYATGTDVYIDNTLFARNNAAGAVGDGIRLYTGASMAGLGNTFAYNDSAGAATGRAIDLFGASLTLDCSIVWGHSSSISPSGEAVTYSDIEGAYAGTGNVNVNPLFVSAAGSDYHLQSSSPVIDRCPYFSGHSPDFDNEVRPVVRVTGATPYDMGADEVTVDRVGVNGACTYGTIQQAVNAASNGDVVRISAGIYFENVDITGKDITLEGGYNSGCTSVTGGTTRLEGSNGSSSTLDVTNGLVTLRNLDIAWGDGVGGGVDVRSSAEVTLDNTDLFKNYGTSGGGAYVAYGSVLTATNDADIYANTASSSGGGARVLGQFYGIGTSSDITANCASDGGGVSVAGGGLLLDDSDVMDNQAAGATGRGGGLFVDGGTATLTGNAWVSNQDAYDGAGIYADSATISLDSTSTTLTGNTADRYGGGILLANGSALTTNGARVGHTTLPSYGNVANYGAGLYVDGSTVNGSGQVYNNVASLYGGGIYATAGTLNLTHVSVGGTGTNQANQLGTSGHYGAGLYLAGGSQATLDSSVIAGNTFQTSGFTYGGGAYVAGTSALTLTNGSRIEYHTAPSATDGRGAGIYISNGTVTLDSSEVSYNTAGAVGGGIRMLSTSTLNVTNGSSISNNESSNGEGGGIAAVGMPDINVSDSTLQHNHAGGDGGAVYLDAGTLDFTGWWDVRWNDSDANGGAVAVHGTADADFDVSSAQSLLGVNHADGNGGALYVTNNDTVALYATAGYPLLLNTNTASGNGGAVYANGGAYFDVYGRLQATSNVAGGYGGVFYLSSGSTLWLDDFGSEAADVLVNRADQGGAIYAVDSPRVECDGAIFGGASNGNEATAGSGGAIFLSNSTFSAENCTFQRNLATLNGGAVAAEAGSSMSIGSTYGAPSTLGQDVRRAPGTPLASVCDPLTGQCSSFHRNVADSDTNGSGNGGALYVYNSMLQLGHSYLHRNSAFLGGAIYQTGGAPIAEVNNTLIYSNTIGGTAGAGIRVNGGTLTATHVTLAHNVGPGYSASAVSSNQVYNSIAWGNTGGGFVGTTFVATSCNIDQSGTAGVISNPQFASPGAGEDYRIPGTSTAVDACASGLTPDLDNTARPVGGGYDMGAYESLCVVAGAVTPHVSITLAANDVILAWMPHSNNSEYEIHSSSTPYFTPGGATHVATLPAGSSTYTHSGGAGTPGTNYYYFVIGKNCGGSEATSNHTAEFDFAIVPGT